jgi:hypothetical protein
MDFFFIQQEKNGENIRDYFWVFLGVASWKFIIKKNLWCLKQTKEKPYILIYINIQEFNIWKDII